MVENLKGEVLDLSLATAQKNPLLKFVLKTIVKNLEIISIEEKNSMLTSIHNFLNIREYISSFSFYPVLRIDLRTS